jgi:hypothetical protein
MTPIGGLEMVNNLLALEKFLKKNEPLKKSTAPILSASEIFVSNNSKNNSIHPLRHSASFIRPSCRQHTLIITITTTIIITLNESRVNSDEKKYAATKL